MSNNSSKDSIFIVDYTEKAIAVFGDTKIIKDHLAGLGGKFNPSLKGDNDDKRAGWIFPKTKRSEVQSLLEKSKKGELPTLNNEENSSSKPHAFEPKRSVKNDSEFILTKEMYLSLVTRIEKLETELALTKKIIFKENNSSTSTSVTSSKKVVSDKVLVSKNPVVFEDSESEESKSEEEEYVPPKRLLNLKK
jgi:hypothetical protein